jgi:hypothetical protein
MDLRSLDDRSALVLVDGKPSAWCGVALAAAGKWIGGGSAAAESAWVSARVVALAAATAVSLDRGGLSVSSDRPVGLLIDLAGGKLAINPGSPGSEGARIVLSIDGIRGELVLAGRFETIIPPDCCVRIAAEISTWLAAGSHQAVAAVPAVKTPQEGGWAGKWTFDGGTRVRERVRNLRVTTNPLPIDGYPDQLVDTVLPELREIWRQWPVARNYAVALTFPEPRPVTSVAIVGDCIDDPTLRTFSPLPEGIRVEADLAGGGTQLCPVGPAPDRRFKRYRDAENRLETKTATVNATVASLRLDFPAPPSGRPFVLHEIEVFGDKAIPPAVTHWVADDINGDGRREIVVFNESNELIAVDDGGRELWRIQMPVSLTHLSCQQLDAKGSPTICAGLLGGELRLVSGDGSTRAAYRITEDFRKCKDILQGWFNAIHSVAVWHRGADGRASLVIGGYAVIVFLNADGSVVGHSFADGPWCNNILAVPEGRPGAGDLYLRVGWNHGIMQYAGFPGTGPSGATLNFGGFIQPMFRKMRRITPFVNGRSVAYEWADVPSCPGGSILAAAELGCGLFSLEDGDWKWKIEGGMSLAACTSANVGGRAAAVIGGADGFVTAVDLESGRVIRSTHAGAPVVGLAQADPSGELIVATRAGVRLLDASWIPRAACARPLRRMLAMGPGRVAIIRDDCSVELLGLEGRALK